MSEPIAIPPEILKETMRRFEEVDRDPSILIDEEEVWRRVEGDSRHLTE